MIMQEFVFELPECDMRLKKQNYHTVVTELMYLPTSKPCYCTLMYKTNYMYSFNAIQN